MTIQEKIKFELREEQFPFFSDSDIDYYLSKNNQDFNKTVYEMLILKSEDSTIVVSGLTTSSTSSYFKRLASRFRPRNSGILR